MRSEWLADAIAELAATNPEKLTIKAGPGNVGFKLSASGPLGSAEVEFDRSKADAQEATTIFSRPNTNAGPTEKLGGHGVLETFLVQSRNINSYKFSMVQAATLAMKQAVKVSIRVDDQGVLSLQFMIEVETASGGPEAEVSFVDFRFVPLVGDGEDEEDGRDGDDASTEEE
jgi:cell cycle checkpoint protein